MNINGHELPKDVVSAMKGGLWSLPVEAAEMKEIFHGLTSFKFATLFSQDEMRAENQFLESEFKENSPAEIGWAIAERSDRDDVLQRTDCILIGNFRMDDSPIALDLRKGCSRICYLSATDPARWKVAFEDVKDFIAWLRIHR